MEIVRPQVSQVQQFSALNAFRNNKTVKQPEEVQKNRKLQAVQKQHQLRHFLTE